MNEPTYKVKWQAEREMTLGEIRDFVNGRVFIDAPGFDNFVKACVEIEYNSKQEIKIGDFGNYNSSGDFYIDADGQFVATGFNEDGRVNVMMRNAPAQQIYPLDSLVAPPWSELYEEPNEY